VETSFDIVAALSALGGAFVGGMVMAVRWGRNEGIVSVKLDNLGDRLTLISDELARRITILEQRYQYDGLYSTPRIKRMADNEE